MLVDSPVSSLIASQCPYVTEVKDVPTELTGFINCAIDRGQGGGGTRGGRGSGGGQFEDETMSILLLTKLEQSTSFVARAYNLTVHLNFHVMVPSTDAIATPVLHDPLFSVGSIPVMLVGIILTFVVEFSSIDVITVLVIAHTFTASIFSLMLHAGTDVSACPLGCN